MRFRITTIQMTKNVSDFKQPVIVQIIQLEGVHGRFEAVWDQTIGDIVNRGTPCKDCPFQDLCDSCEELCEESRCLRFLNLICAKSFKVDSPSGSIVTVENNCTSIPSLMVEPDGYGDSWCATRVDAELMPISSVRCLPYSSNCKADQFVDFRVEVDTKLPNPRDFYLEIPSAAQQLRCALESALGLTSVVIFYTDLSQSLGVDFDFTVSRTSVRIRVDYDANRRPPDTFLSNCPPSPISIVPGPDGLLVTMADIESRLTEINSNSTEFQKLLGNRTFLKIEWINCFYQDLSCYSALRSTDHYINEVDLIWDTIKVAFLVPVSLIFAFIILAFVILNIWTKKKNNINEEEIEILESHPTQLIYHETADMPANIS
eukprot:GHVL01020545.1.p1 GENE.GHVL01020545.1~~GHVL01020545.1.p1  ORF type:complete len:374 (+),score=47.54 GHVL01020545.1:599-1720(+)